MLGAYQRPAGEEVKADLARCYELFPVLADRRDQRSGTLSGGERQMLAIGRALMARPELLILDEPSLGLAPLIIENIFEVIQRINREGVTIFLVEQNVNLTLEVARYAYILENGALAGEGVSAELVNDPRIQ